MVNIYLPNRLYPSEALAPLREYFFYSLKEGKPTSRRQDIKKDSRVKPSHLCALPTVGRTQRVDFYLSIKRILESTTLKSL